MQLKRFAKLALLMVLLVLTLQISTPKPGAAVLTCQQECSRNYFGCMHACGLSCIGDDACLTACNAGCADDKAACLSEC